ncbi:hypothetical protein HK098_000625 [Nowakowskiella sp. JEL0407]|nr:hypothetical protein HK098_000625 [Nowakowskiella sp. JEL0407]
MARIATVVSKTRCVVAVLMEDQFKKTLAKYPETSAIIKDEAHQRYDALTKELERQGKKLFAEKNTKNTNGTLRRDNSRGSLKDLVLTRQGSKPNDQIIEGASSPIERAEAALGDKIGEYSGQDLSTPITEDSKIPEFTSRKTSIISLPATGSPGYFSGSRTNSTSVTTATSETPTISGTFNLINRLNSKRRESVAVWADDKLSQMAQKVSESEILQKATETDRPLQKQPTNKRFEILKVESIDSFSDVSQDGNIFEVGIQEKQVVGVLTERVVGRSVQAKEIKQGDL